MDTCVQEVAAERSAARAWHAWVWPALCCGAVLFAILLANPFNEAGFDDDWSYARVAQLLALTGHMQYNGWGSPLILFQSVWAVPWIRLFGVAVPVLQASIIPLSLCFVLLVYATGRRAGLSETFAAFAAIGAGACPMFLPFAASFMTESCGCLFGMLCIYCALAAVQAEDRRRATGWLWALTIAGLVGGANRQIMWAAPVALVPYVAWERRAERAFTIHAMVAFGALGAAIVLLVHFFSQPYAPLDGGYQRLAWLLVHQSGVAGNWSLHLLLVGVLLCVPAFFALLPRIPWRPAVRTLAGLFAAVVLTAEAAMFGWPLAPFGTNIVTIAGIAIGPQDSPGNTVVIWPFWLRAILTIVVNLCVAMVLVWAVRVWRGRSRMTGRLALRVFGAFAIVYLPFLLPGMLLGIAFDRYMLPLIPLAFIAIMMQAGRGRSRPPTAAWICLFVFSAYAVATTHDYYARLRAQIEAAHRVEAGGVGRNLVSAGFEYDGWTQMKSGEPTALPPYRDPVAADAAKGFWFDFWDRATALDPEYVALNWTRPEAPPAGELAVEFRAWMPPFRRTVVMWKRADLTAEMQAARVIAATRLGR